MPLTRQIGNVFLPEEISAGSFEFLKLPNSEQFVAQYSRQISSGRIVFGLGTSKDPKLAQIKAYAEFVERKAFLDSSKQHQLSSTNGVATHILCFIAEKNAKDELFERDSFLMHWYSETPMIPLSTHETYLNTEIDATSQLGFYTRFYKTFLGYQETIVCFLISKKTGGFCIGLCSGKGRKNDLHKAFLEASINLFLCENGKSAAVLKEYNDIRLKHHRDFWLFEQTLPKWILIPPQPIEECRKDPIFETISLPCEHFSTVSVQSKHLLGLSVGFASENDVALVEKRLNNSDFKIKINKNLIHPIP